MKTNQKHNLVFFAKEGISSSHANHISNLLKEQNTIISKRLSGARAFNYNVVLDGKPHWVTTSTQVEVDDWTKEGRYFALSAWLKEAIKAKTTLLEFYRTCDASEFLTDEEKIPEFTETAPVFNKPLGVKAWTETDAVGELSIAERAEYYALEAQASHIGKYIHTGGVMSNIKNDLAGGPVVGFHKILQNGQQTEIPMFAKSNFDQDRINKEYFDLQAKHREYESKLNSYKARIQNRVTEKNAELQREFTLASVKASNEFDTISREYNMRFQKYQNELESLNSVLQTRRLEKIREVSAYKIVIPNALADIYQEIDNLGK
jgi:hypothetical protein